MADDPSTDAGKIWKSPLKSWQRGDKSTGKPHGNGKFLKPVASPLQDA
jgi:hypothetical protein